MNSTEIRLSRPPRPPPARESATRQSTGAPERAFWAVVLFCGLRRGELRSLQRFNVDLDAKVIRVERSWNPVKGPVDVTGAGRRAVPMAFVVRTAHGPQGADRT